MATVSFEHVTKRFGEYVAVDDFNLEIQDREFVVLVGPSGCGKSTTLRMLAGLEKLSEGTIKIGGRVVNHILPKERDIAMVFQNYALYPHMTVYKNMAFGLRLRKFSKDEIDLRVRNAAEILDIHDLLKRKPRELSGGQRQRVAVGRAIVRKPSVFLFDEPLSNLDAKLRVQMRTEILKLYHRLQTTILYVTHDQIEAMTMGNKIVIMNAGKTLQVGRPIDVYNSPDNRFVAGFIGSPAMNFLEVTLVDEGGKLYVDGEKFRFPIPADKAQGYMEFKGQRCTFGIRPEHIYEQAQSKGHDPTVLVEARVELIELVGPFAILQIAFGGQIVVVQVDSSTQAEIGKKIALVFDMQKMHLFSTQPPYRRLGR